MDTEVRKGLSPIFKKDYIGENYKSLMYTNWEEMKLFADDMIIYV